MANDSQIERLRCNSIVSRFGRSATRYAISVVVIDSSVRLIVTRVATENGERFTGTTATGMNGGGKRRDRYD